MDLRTTMLAMLAALATAHAGSRVRAEIVTVSLDPRVRTSHDIDLNQDGARDYFAAKINACRDCWEWIGPYESFAIQGYQQPWQAESGVTNNGIVSRNGQVALLSPGEIVHQSNPTMNWIHGFGELSIEGVSFFPKSHDPDGPRTGYLGVHFEAADGFHYGWIQFQLETWSELPLPDSLNLETGPGVLAWAFESTPNTPIVVGAVPEPASVVLALVGVIAVVSLRWRRARRSAASLGG